MIDARTLALLDLLHDGYLAPHPGQLNYDDRLQEWTERYRRRLEAAMRLLDAVATIEPEEPECPSLP